MDARRFASIAVAVGLAGCGSQASAGTTTHARAGRPYRLYTHCGIEWARIDGTFWHAAHPLADGQRNPPAGWGNPYEEGTLVVITHTTARFESPAGSVTFRRTSRISPPFLCS